MFTGLIREMATVVHFNGSDLRLKAAYRPGIGDSIAVNGACLTVTALHNDGFSVELSEETQRIVAPENYRGNVHMEPAMRLGERIEGHMVQGHIDAVGTVRTVKPTGNGTDFTIAVDTTIIPFIVPKGSIAVDGVSLTVNDVYEQSFRLTIIPHTLGHTLFKTYAPGHRVNIETDMFARTLIHYLKAQQKSPSWQDVDRIAALY